MAKYTLEYGTDNYTVRDPKGKIIYLSYSKSHAIKRAQKLNGYEPADGEENTYNQQSKEG